MDHSNLALFQAGNPDFNTTYANAKIVRDAVQSLGFSTSIFANPMNAGTQGMLPEFPPAGGGDSIQDLQLTDTDKIWFQVFDGNDYHTAGQVVRNVLVNGASAAASSLAAELSKPDLASLCASVLSQITA